MVSNRRALAVAVGTSFRADRWRSAAVIVLSVVASLAVVLNPYWLKGIVDGAGAGDEGAALAGAVGLSITVGLRLLARSSATRLQFPLKENTGVYLDQRIIELVGGIATVEHHERPVYLDRLEVLRREAPVLSFAGVHTATALALLAEVSATGFLLASVHPLLLGVPLFSAACFWAGARAERIRQSALDATADRSRLARHLFELATSPTAGKELRVFGLGQELLYRHRATWADMDSVLDAAALRGLGWTVGGWLLFTAGYAAAIAFVVGQAVAGRATVGDVVLALALVAQVNRQVSLTVDTVTALMRTVNVAHRYLWLTNYATASRTVIEDPAPVPTGLVRGIDLRGVTFRYPDTDVDVLAGLNLSIPAGATVALVGANGAGKSTLVKLLCRFYEPSEGVITVDGIDIRAMDVCQWRERISAGFQDFARLELLARQSVGVGDLPFIDDETAVAAALERAASSDVVSALADGLETQLGASFEEGVELSGGQWQKLALARAMMRPVPLLLILDEPTSSLDAETEHRLFERYASAASELATLNGAITLVVSHRFSTVRMAELIVVVDGGRIVETGSHEELMASGTLYAELYALQARAYR